MIAALELTILILGLIGSAIATVCYLPGVIKVCRTKDTVSISLWQYILSTFGCYLWVVIAILDFIYSYYFKTEGNLYVAFMLALPLLISNLGLGICASIILAMKAKNVHRAKKLHMTESQYLAKKKK